MLTDNIFKLKNFIELFHLEKHVNDNMNNTVLHHLCENNA